MIGLLSQQLKDIRDGFKSHVHGGVTLSAYEIVGLIAFLDEFIAIAREQESRISRHRRADAEQFGNPVTESGNVVLFPSARRQTWQPPRGGGDAA